MTLSQKSLRKWEESAHIIFSAEQKRLILELFGNEPDDYVWSQQDIAEGIRKICRDYPPHSKCAL